MRVVELNTVAGFIDQLLDVSKESDREGNGLAFVARQTVSKIGAAVNTSFESIQGAEEAGADLLLVHHASWKSIDLHLKEAKFARLEQTRISLYAAHEALDNAPGLGTAETLAALLELQIEDRLADGYGVYGLFPSGSLDTLVECAKAKLKVPVEYWQNNPECRKVAILPGGAGLTKYLHEAKELGCDTYITGEGSLYTKLFAREIGINLIFGSHYATELPAVKALAARVAEEFELPWETIPEDPVIRRQSAGGRNPKEGRRFEEYTEKTLKGLLSIQR